VAEDVVSMIVFDGLVGHSGGPEIYPVGHRST
jgi:hypothetical protein